jgi:hypothetical protein
MLCLAAKRTLKYMAHFERYPHHDTYPSETFVADQYTMNPPWTEAVLYSGKGKDAQEIGRVPLEFGQVLLSRSC